jgi:hypothetical protein
MSYSKENHSFCVHLAIKYGMEKAALIHHFQHWINLNKRKKSSIHYRDGKWWTYQKRSDISAALPYLSEDSIRHHCEGLVELGILKTGNFNKLKIDKTLWYAFVDEFAYLDPDEEIKEMFTKGENPNRGGENPKAIPDPKTTDIKKLPLPPTQRYELYRTLEGEAEMSKETIRRKMPSVKNEEFEYAWKEYLKAPIGSVKSVRKWLFSVIQRHRYETQSFIDKDLERKQHKEQAKYKEMFNPKNVVACNKHVEFIRGSQVKIVEYDMPQWEWEEKTGWKKGEIK